MSVRRSEFPLLENALSVILTFNNIENKQLVELEKRKSIARRTSIYEKKGKEKDDPTIDIINEDEYNRKVANIDLKSLIDHDSDFAGLHREVKGIVLNPRMRPVMMAASHTRDYVRSKRKQKLQKPVAMATKKLKAIKDKSKSDFVKTMCDVAWLGIRVKLDL